ncbi:MAG: putative DNA binding domain-containing protein [Bacteroidales bacterium]|nr:putative DNA binding domain-containing protein [Bacteroidales bacterium]
MDTLDLQRLIERLVSLAHESEIVEFKENFHSKEEIGERISALSNSACLLNQPYAYLVFGVTDSQHQIVGTKFRSKNQMVGNEELEVWLLNRLNPKIDFRCYDFQYDDHINISLYKIPAADNMPVKFLNESYIRINSSTRKLINYPEKEKQIWKNEATEKFLLNEVIKNLSLADIPTYLNTETYFDLLKIPYPVTLKNVVMRFKEEGFIVEYDGQYSITNLGALLFAKNINDFGRLSRRCLRIVKYKGKGKIETERDILSSKGYAIELPSFLEHIYNLLPANEIIGRTFRTNTKMYPEIAIRELVINSVIHQDFSTKGFPTVEIFDDRIEFSNPGQPIINSDRFIDEYSSRNEKLADIMRRMGFCEEKGSGLDKTIFNVELYQLPAIKITIQENRTILTLYSYKTINTMTKEEKIRACYQHACLKYVTNETMTNQSLRGRFGIEEHNAAIVSRILKDTMETGKVKEENPDSQSRKYRKYIPWWA